MISNRESNLFQAHILMQAVLLFAAYWLCLSIVLLGIYQESIPMGSYLLYLGIIFAAFLLEAGGRPRNLRLSVSESRRAAWRVTVRQATVISLALLVFLVFAKDNRISRGFLAFYTVTALTLIFLSNRFLFRRLIRLLVKKSPSWSLRTVVMGPEGWTRSITEKLAASGSEVEINRVIHLQAKASLSRGEGGYRRC